MEERSKNVYIVLLIFLGIIIVATVRYIAVSDFNSMKYDAILADGLAVENAARLICAERTCSDTEDFTWSEVSPYIEGIDLDYYDFLDDPIVVRKSSEGWQVYLEASNTGMLELTKWVIPSQEDRRKVIEDID